MLPGQPIANRVPHLPPAFFAQGVVDRITPIATTTLGFAVTDKVY
jgi:hypothetical protein